MKLLAAKPWSPVFRRIDLKNATIKLKDSDSNTLTIKVGEGNATWTERINREYELNRGSLDEVRNGDEVPVELRIDCVWEYIKTNSTAATPTIEDALKNVGGAIDWVSSDTDDACRPYAVDVEIEHQPTCDGDNEIVLLSDFRYEQLDHDLRAGTLSVSGRCNITAPTVTRDARSSTQS